MWRGYREEAKRGQPCGHRVTRNCEAMVSLLLTCATPWVALLAVWYLLGANPSGSAVDAGLDAAARARWAARAADGGVVYVP